MERKRLVYSALGVAVLAIAGFLIYQALNESLVYFVLPSEYAANAAQYENRMVRLGGIVEKGSVSFNQSDVRLVFNVSDSIETFQVSHYGAPPELFQEETGVVVEGHFENGVFMSDNVLVKHSEVYRVPEDGHINLDDLREALQ